MNTGARSVRVQPGERGPRRRRVLAQDVQPALLGRRRHAVEAPLDAPDAVADEPADDADLGGDEDRRGDLGPVPLPAVQVEEEVDAGREQRDDGGGAADRLAFMPPPPRRSRSESGRDERDGAGVAVDGDDVAVAEALVAPARPTTVGTPCSRARIARWLSGLPVSATRPARRGMTVGQARVEVADDEHAARPGPRRRPSWTWTGAVTVPPPAPTAPARRPDRAGAPAAAAPPTARPSSSSRKRAGRARRRDASGAPIVGTSATRRADGALELVEARWRTSSAARSAPRATRRRAELDGGPRHQLLDPADAQPQRLAGDGRAVGHRRRRRARPPARAATMLGERRRRRRCAAARARARRARVRRARRADVPSACARAIASRASEAPVTRGRRGRRDQQADERLVAVQADERAPAVASTASSCSSRQVVERRDRGEVGVDVVDEVGGERRRARCAAGRPATRPAGGGPAGAGRGAAAARGAASSTPSSGEVGGGEAVDGDDERRCARTARAGDVPASSSASRRPSRSGSSHRSCSSVASGSGNVSATGPGPNTVPDVGGSVVIGRACSRRRRAVGVDGPLDVLRAAERAAGVGREPGELAQHGGRRTRRVTGRTDLHDAATAVEDGRPAVDGARHELVGPAGDGGDDDAVVAAGQRIGAEQHAAPRRREHRLHEHGHLGIDEAGAAGPVGGGVDLLDGREQRRARRRRRGSTRTRRPSTTRRRPRRSTTTARRPARARRRRRRATRRRASSRAARASTPWSGRRRAGSAARRRAPGPGWRPSPRRAPRRWRAGRRAGPRWDGLLFPRHERRARALEDR